MIFNIFKHFLRIFQTKTLNNFWTKVYLEMFKQKIKVCCHHTYWFTNKSCSNRRKTSHFMCSFDIKFYEKGPFEQDALSLMKSTWPTCTPLLLTKYICPFWKSLSWTSFKRVFLHMVSNPSMHFITRTHENLFIKCY